MLLTETTHYSNYFSSFWLLFNRHRQPPKVSLWEFLEPDILHVRCPSGTKASKRNWSILRWC